MAGSHRALIIVLIGGWVAWRTTNTRWAKRQVPRIEELAQAGNYFAAYDLATPVQKYLGEDETLNRLMPRISDVISVNSDPPGAQVYLKRFTLNEPDKSQRFLIGTTPVNSLSMLAVTIFFMLKKTVTSNPRDRSPALFCTQAI